MLGNERGSSPSPPQALPSGFCDFIETDVQRLGVITPRGAMTGDYVREYAC